MFRAITLFFSHPTPDLIDQILVRGSEFDGFPYMVASRGTLTLAAKVPCGGCATLATSVADDSPDSPGVCNFCARAQTHPLTVTELRSLGLSSDDR